MGSEELCQPQIAPPFAKVQTNCPEKILKLTRWDANALVLDCFFVRGLLLFEALFGINLYLPIDGIDNPYI